MRLRQVPGGGGVSPLTRSGTYSTGPPASVSCVPAPFLGAVRAPVVEGMRRRRGGPADDPRAVLLHVDIDLVHEGQVFEALHAVLAGLLLVGRPEVDRVLHDGQDVDEGMRLPGHDRDLRVPAFRKVGLGIRYRRHQRGAEILDHAPHQAISDDVDGGTRRPLPPGLQA